MSEEVLRRCYVLFTTECLEESRARSLNWGHETEIHAVLRRERDEMRAMWL